MAMLIVACDCRYYDDWHTRKYKGDVVYYGNLSLYEEKLFGVWGCTDVWFGNEQVKEIVISDYGLANIQLQDGVYTDRYNRTYKYVYSGKTLTFVNPRNERESFFFSIYDYRPGSLLLHDSMGIHELRLYSVCY
jgi:hypothetical protein